MKHIKKRFLIEQEDPEKMDLSGATKYSRKNDEITKDVYRKHKDDVAYVQTDQGFTYGGFLHNLSGSYVIIPVPDPTLVYFHNAQRHLSLIREQKEVLWSKLKSAPEKLSEPALNEIYNFHAVSSGQIIFLFTAIESFVNQMIDDSYVYKIDTGKKTESYSKEQIQNYVAFKDKITTILTQNTQKNFFGKTSSATERIWQLKKIRDRIIHTKQESHLLRYNELMRSLFNFKYEETLEAVATFMNFYRPNYIIECGCGKDF
jgi:hypothetical protein